MLYSLGHRNWFGDRLCDSVKDNDMHAIWQGLMTEMCVYFPVALNLGYYSSESQWGFLSEGRGEQRVHSFFFYLIEV